MATATSKSVTTKTITLTMDQDEAYELASVLAHVAGGDHVYNLFSALTTQTNYSSGKFTGSIRIAP